MIDLKDMWDVQKKFQLNFYDPDNMSDEEKIKFSKEFILSMHRELGEVLNVMPWKLHRANEMEYDIEHLQEELIDCFKFLMNVCIIHGMDAEKFAKTFYYKTAVVDKRYEDEIINK